MKVLILTGRFGMGHASAAAAVKEDLEQVKSNAEFAERRVVGVVAAKEGESLTVQAEALLQDEAKRAAMRARMRAMKRLYEEHSIRGIAGA